MNITSALEHILAAETHKEIRNQKYFQDGLTCYNIKGENKLYILMHNKKDAKDELIIKYGLNVRNPTKNKLNITYDALNNNVHIKISSENSAKTNYCVMVNFVCPMIYTEESYFMESTVVDFNGITLTDFQLIEKIYKKYSRIVRYGK